MVARVRSASADAEGNSDAVSDEGVRTLRIGYALTAVWLAGLVALAEVLAHG